MRAITTEYWGDDTRMFVGIVEKSTEADPLHLGRVKVRIFGLHTEDTIKISTDHLPWATVLAHTQQGGVARQWNTVLQPGARVFGIFMDGKHSQQPMVIGSIPHNPKHRVSHEFVAPTVRGAGSQMVQETSIHTYQKPSEVVDTKSSSTIFSDIPLTTGSNIEQCYNWLFDWLVSEGSNHPAEQAAALCGQIINEAGTSADPTAGPPRDGVSGGTSRWGSEKSYGLMQWNESSGRFGGLDRFATSNGGDWRELIVQLNFIKHELSTRAASGKHECYATLSSLLKTSTVREASEYLIRRYTVPLVAVLYNFLKAGKDDTLAKWLNKSSITQADATNVVKDFEAELNERIEASRTVMNKFGK
jgi:hypothetical protein